MRDFNAIDPVAQPRNIAAWTPVVTEILQGCRDFEDESVSRCQNGHQAGIELTKPLSGTV